jgi:hypothetical protein
MILIMCLQTEYPGHFVLARFHTIEPSRALQSAQSPVGDNRLQ